MGVGVPKRGVGPCSAGAIVAPSIVGIVGTTAAHASEAVHATLSVAASIGVREGALALAFLFLVTGGGWRRPFLSNAHAAESHL